MESPVHRNDFCDEVEHLTNVWQTMGPAEWRRPAPPLTISDKPGSGSRGHGSYDQLRTFLAASARDTDLVLWLDQVHHIDDFEEFYRHFLAPRRPRAELRVRFVIVDSQEWVDGNLTDIRFAGIPVTPVSLSDGPSYARELLSRRHRYPPTDEDYKKELREIGNNMVRWLEGLAIRPEAGPHLDVEQLFKRCSREINAAGLPGYLLRKW
jgi:hypothetical protein